MVKKIDIASWFVTTHAVAGASRNQLYIYIYIYPVSPKKLWSRTLATTLSNLNRFQKFLHCCKEEEISNKPCVIILTTP